MLTLFIRFSNSTKKNPDLKRGRVVDMLDKRLIRSPNKGKRLNTPKLKASLAPLSTVLTSIR